MNLDFHAFLVLSLLLVCMFLGFIRLARGPSLADRILALDFIGTIFISLLAVFAIATKEFLYLDVACVAAIIAFLGTVLYAKHIEREDDAK
jgi:multicomponent Na+:H+ antiporter subunit F